MDSHEIDLGIRTVQGRTGAAYVTLPVIYQRTCGVVPGTEMSVKMCDNTIVFAPVEKQPKKI